MNQLAQGYLGKRIPGGVKTIKGIKNLWTGEKKLSDIPSNYLASYQGKSPLQAAWQAGKTLNLGKNILGSGKGIMSKALSAAGKALPLLGAGAGIAYLHRNRERFTGYPTQIAYEQARQERINIDRIDMRSDPKTLENLKINWKRQGFNDDEIRDKTNQFKGDTTKMKADIVGADIFNPNEMKNLDENFENIKYNIDPSDVDPSWTGEDPEGQAEASPTVSETAAMEDININQAPVITPYVPPPPQLPQAPPGSGDRHGGGGGYRGDPGGGTRGSPFKKGGRIDKALGGRSRDI